AEGNKGETGGKGGNGPGTGPVAGEAAPPEAPSPTALRTNPDTATRRVEVTKPWEIGASFETHRLIRQDDLEGQGANKVFNVLGAFARYDLSEHDRISVSDF